MKRLALLVSILVFATALFAQKASGSFKALKSESRARVEIDFSVATIHGMSESDFAEYERDWEKDKPEITSLFVGNMQEELHNRLVLGNYPNAKHTIKVEVLSVNSNGDYVCDVVLLDGSTELGRITNIYARGGRVGSKLNLIKDGAKHTGEAVGAQLKKRIK